MDGYVVDCLKLSPGHQTSMYNIEYEVTEFIKNSAGLIFALQPAAQECQEVILKHFPAIFNVQCTVGLDGKMIFRKTENTNVPWYSQDSDPLEWRVSANHQSARCDVLSKRFSERGYRLGPRNGSKRCTNWLARK